MEIGRWLEAGIGDADIDEAYADFENAEKKREIHKFAEAEGKNAGEFYTPACVVRTLVEILQPFNGRVYDPCCGSGGMFVQSARFVQNHSGNINKIAVYGQEANATTRKMALMNLAIRGIEANLGPHQADTFTNDLHPTLKADFVMANINTSCKHVINDHYEAQHLIAA